MTNKNVASPDENVAVNSDDARTLGVEEEFHLVDLRTRRLTARASEVLAALAGSSRTFAAELQQTVVETNTTVVSDLGGLRGQVEGLRAELIDRAESLGIGIASAGTMPLSSAATTITETPRFRRMLADYQLLVREQLICGMQVHVGIANRDVAVRLLARIAPWLPPLLALSCSSPFAHDGQDSGYASSRSLIWSRWPTTGSVGAVNSAAEYETVIRQLVASGTISDRGMIYFDVRPSAHAPTLELRICDACPLVDTVVLIAALYRAVVRRELTKLAEGAPLVQHAPPLLRAAMWRASRSGLEGELVDLSGPRSVPASALLRSMVDELRTELTGLGDWEEVRALVDEAVHRGSSAARQREVLRKRGHVADVVDLIVDETRGGPARAERMSVLPNVLSDYPVHGWDEALRADGVPRPSHAAVLEVLARLGPVGLRTRAAALEEAKAKTGVAFRVSDRAAPSAFPVDLVPRVLSGEEWSRLQGGTAQRARALDAFLRDAYGEGRAVRDGVIPAALLASAPGRHEAGAAIAARARRVHVSGFDIVRGADGRWLVLEDNVRVPSGIAFAIVNRRLLRQCLPELLGTMDFIDPEGAPGILHKTLVSAVPEHASEAARRGEPHIVLLSEGPSDSAYFEHRFLADAMSIALVQPADLAVDTADGLPVLVHGPSRTRVDVVYLRIDDRLAHRTDRDGRPLGAGIVAAVRAGTVTVANGFGNGLADDKAVYAYVPKLIEYYLSESPLLEQVPTYLCSRRDHLELVLDRAAELVIKPVDGYGGFGVVIGPQATPDELDRARSLVLEQPARWIAQDVVTLSTHPTLQDGTLVPRHVDLRVFVYFGDAPVVAPAALTRVAPAGSMIVNSSRGGGAKDTWIVG